MAIFTGGDARPIGTPLRNEVGAEAAYARVEPFITVEQVKSRFLFGIPLASFLVNPITHQRDRYTDDMIKDEIVRAVNDVELDTGVTITPTEIVERLPFDIHHFRSWGFIKVRYRPISRILELSIRPSENVQGAAIMVLDNSWIEVGQLHKGIISLIPWLTGSSSVQSQSPSFSMPTMGGGYALSTLGCYQFVPSFWRINAVVGFEQARVPVVVNELVGTIAAMRVLSELQATNRIGNYSVGIDSANQSVSSGGTEVYATRLKDLEISRAQKMNRIKKAFGTGILLGEV
jgi:hypothetical protein